MLTMEKTSYVYIMSSASRRALYTGVTAHLNKRVFEHKNNLIEGFTSKYKCHRLVYFEHLITWWMRSHAKKKSKDGAERKRTNWLNRKILNGKIWQQIGIRKHF